MQFQSLQTNRSPVISSLIIIRAFIGDNGDFGTVNADIVIGSYLVYIHLENSLFTTFLADCFDLDHLGYTKTSEFPDALAPKNAPFFDRRTFYPRTAAPCTPNVQESVLALVELHPYSVVANDDLGRPADG